MDILFWISLVYIVYFGVLNTIRLFYSTTLDSKKHKEKIKKLEKIRWI